MQESEQAMKSKARMSELYWLSINYSGFVIGAELDECAVFVPAARVAT